MSVYLGELVSLYFTITQQNLPHLANWPLLNIRDYSGRTGHSFSLQSVITQQSWPLFIIRAYPADLTTLNSK
jgi:hypothetical protein